MLIPFKEIRTMGVINITPNSFSETESMLLNKEALKNKLIQFKNIAELIFDFGFESTAPLNHSISSAVERERFDLFLENISDVDLSGQWISFDTYRPQNFLYFEEKFKARYNHCGFIFNDVSGVLDRPLVELLQSKKNQKNFYYIFNHTHIPSRDKVLNHMEYLYVGNSLLKEIGAFFKKGFETFSEIGIENKIIFDPGFGFSKSYDQNWELLRGFDQLYNDLKNSGIITPWLIGLSKKSFLRKSFTHSLDPFSDAEILQDKLIKELISKKLGHLLFRLHDPFLIKTL